MEASCLLADGKDKFPFGTLPEFSYLKILVSFHFSFDYKGTLTQPQL